MLVQISLGGLLQLFLGQGVVLVRHADVIEDIRVAGFRDHDPARYLPVLVRILVDQLELPRGRVIIDLEIIAGQLARLELDVLGQPGDLVLVRIKGDILVRHVIDPDCLAFGFPLDGTRAGERTDPPGVDRIEYHLPLDDPVPRVLLKVSQGRGQVKIIGTVP